MHFINVTYAKINETKQQVQRPAISTRVISKISIFQMLQKVADIFK